MEHIQQAPETSSVQYEDRKMPKEGDRISWENIEGDKFYGTVYEMDSNVAFVIGDDGSKHAIEC